MPFPMKAFEEAYTEFRERFPKWHIQSLGEDVDPRGRRLSLWECSIKRGFNGPFVSAFDCCPGGALRAAMASAEGAK